MTRFETTIDAELMGDALIALDWLVSLKEADPKGDDGRDQWSLAWAAARKVQARIMRDRAALQ